MIMQVIMQTIILPIFSKCYTFTKQSHQSCLNLLFSKHAAMLFNGNFKAL